MSNALTGPLPSPSHRIFSPSTSNCVSNPFAINQVKSAIKQDLDPLYQGQYEIQVVPNIVHIGYGRGVGYTIEEEKFDDAITDISATKIRKELGLK